VILQIKDVLVNISTLAKRSGKRVFTNLEGNKSEVVKQRLPSRMRLFEPLHVAL